MPCLQEHLHSFLESLRQRHYSPASIQGYRDGVRAFFHYIQSEGLHDIREVTAQTLAAYQSWLSRKTSSVWTIHQRLQSLRRFFEYLQSTDQLLLNPAAALRLPPIKERLPRLVLTRQECRRLLNAPDTHTKKGLRDRAILEVFYSSAIRREEMARLQVEDANPREGCLHIVRGKGGKGRVVPLGKKACFWLRRYLDHVRRDWSKEHPEQRALWLASPAPHPPLKPSAFNALVARYSRIADLPQRVSPHVWRHTCATHLVGSGANILCVQRLLGHRHLDTTQRYTRVAIPELLATHRRSHPRERGAR
jgi:integrase/recombinase XerD